MKKAIAERVEANIGSLLEDLIVGAWLVYGLSRADSQSELHTMAAGIINTFELHKFGWSTSWLMPNAMMLEGDDDTLEERITQYCDKARGHEQQLRQSLVMMVATIRIFSADTPQDLMRQWADAAMDRHHMTFDEPQTGIDIPNFVPAPKTKVVQ